MAQEPDQSAVEWLWRELDGHRGRHGGTGLLDLLQGAGHAGVSVGWREMVWLLERVDRRSGMWTPGVFVIEFLRAYLARRHAKRLVDPAVTGPALLLALADGDIAQSALGLTAFPRLPISLIGIDADGRVPWDDGWRVPPVPAGSPDLGSPDLIVSAPPANLSLEKVSYLVDGPIADYAKHRGTSSMAGTPRCATRSSNASRRWLVTAASPPA
jgi:hypothetical protein